MVFGRFNHIVLFMQLTSNISLKFLGQAGFLLKFDDKTILIDPYLSHSVQKEEGDHQKRKTPIAINSQQIKDVDLVLITHEHLDHCDPETLFPIYKNNPRCLFLAPFPVVEILNKLGFSSNRVICCSGNGNKIDAIPWLDMYSLPAAHPDIELDENGNNRFIGFVIISDNITIYHSGDTSLCRQVIDAAKAFYPVKYALLPVNECNYFKNAQNIIGNMTIREAFSFAEELGTECLVPTHWDMFENNQVFPEEIELLYKLLKPRFKLNLIDPAS